MQSMQIYFLTKPLRNYFNIQELMIILLIWKRVNSNFIDPFTA